MNPNILYSTYRLTTDYKLGGTNTFRRSSVKRLEFWGSNSQNPSKNLCSTLTADLGYKLIQCDQAGAEALIVAYLAPGALYRALFLNGVKPHVFVALHLFSGVWKQELGADKWSDDFLNKPIAELKSLPNWRELDSLIKSSDTWPSNQRYYFIGKQVSHSSNYGVEGEAFRQNVLLKSGGTIALDRKQADEFIMKYRTLFPEIFSNWHVAVQQELRRSRTLRNLFGYPRYFGGPMTGNFFKEAYAFVPQSTVGCITAKCIVNLQHYIEDNGLDWHILNDKHDSVLFQVPAAEVSAATKVVTNFMQQDLTSPLGEKFKMKSEAQVGDNWAPYHPKKNPGGLQ